eukprot:NODE_952_length_1099_cov_111.275720_g908_i0.p1 GENE.NODE_952_length_1099_cov_111.275720_g908_i0~~NODE_952_length_1099_cov_111.275720_g908_i0.p1  ORF type:complete len:358 (-),score=68.93 NODE_952_length_1099_cov_111.275720_g908_i0:26-1048(-)
MRALPTLLLMVAAVAITTTSLVDAQKPKCYYLSRQHKHQVLIYKHVNLAGADEYGEPIMYLDTNENPTGVAAEGNFVYVASYGPVPKKGSGIQYYPKPAIQKWDIRNIKADPTIVTIDEHLQKCFPEDILVHNGVLYVACGIRSNPSILKYNIVNGEYLGGIAPELPAVWGLDKRGDYLYFSSHCHDAIDGCDVEKDDRIFRVPFTGSADDVETVVSSLPSEAEVGHEVGGGFGGLGISPTGHIYVVSHSNDDIFVFNPDGEFSEAFHLHKMANTVDIDFFNGKGYFTNARRGCVYCFAPEQDHDSHMFIDPGPELNSKLTYADFGNCPPEAFRTLRDDL